MKITIVAKSLGFIVIALSLVGFLSGETRIAGGMNTDMFLDITRFGLGAFLVYGGYKSAEPSRTSLSIFGVAYLGMFVLGLMSSTLFGLVPHELGWIDQSLHIGGGLAALLLAMSGEKRTAAI